MVRIMMILLAVFAIQFGTAQNLEIELLKDTVSTFEVFEITYKLNESCRPEQMIFEDFEVVAGPNISKSVSIVNGKRSAETKLIFGLRPKKEGIFNLPNEMCDLVSLKVPTLVVIQGYESSQQREERILSKRTLKKI